MYDFKTFQFGSGAHSTREAGMCIMEAVAYVSGEEHSDAPTCACPVIAAFLRVMNDNVPDARRTELLGDFVFRLVGTRSTPEIEQRRAFMVADFAVRVAAPYALRVCGEEALAVKLESLPEIVDATAAYAAYAADAADAAAYAADAAADAAYAAYAAARAADAAARAADAAARAADAAARAAAYAAYAARAARAARAAADDIWSKATLVVDRMIRLTEPQETVPAASQAVSSK